LGNYQGTDKKSFCEFYVGVLTRWVHLFPFRTESLSIVVPMILAPQGAGKVGRRQHKVHKVHKIRMRRNGVFFVVEKNIKNTVLRRTLNLNQSARTPGVRLSWSG
jgi:hypothetical protein